MSISFRCTNTIRPRIEEIQVSRTKRDSKSSHFQPFPSSPPRPPHHHLDIVLKFSLKRNSRLRFRSLLLLLRKKSESKGKWVENGKMCSVLLLDWMLSMPKLISFLRFPCFSYLLGCSSASSLALDLHHHVDIPMEKHTRTTENVEFDRKSSTPLGLHCNPFHQRTCTTQFLCWVEQKFLSLKLSWIWETNSNTRTFESRKNEKLKWKVSDFLDFISHFAPSCVRCSRRIWNESYATTTNLNIFNSFSIHHTQHQLSSDEECEASLEITTTTNRTRELAWGRVDTLAAAAAKDFRLPKVERAKITFVLSWVEFLTEWRSKNRCCHEH